MRLAFLFGFLLLTSCGSGLPKGCGTEVCYSSDSEEGEGDLECHCSRQEEEREEYGQVDQDAY